MNTNLILVEEFDLAAIRAAFREGRLYIRPAVRTALEIREDGIRAIMEYVSRIDGCASELYRTSVHDIWHHVVHAPELAELFFLTRYANSRGQVNWYRVNVVICLLHELGVYRKEFTTVDLHRQCEGKTKISQHYLGMYRYQLETHYRSIFRHLLDDFAKK